MPLIPPLSYTEPAGKPDLGRMQATSHRGSDSSGRPDCTGMEAAHFATAWTSSYKGLPCRDWPAVVDSHRWHCSCPDPGIRCWRTCMGDHRMQIVAEEQHNEAGTQVDSKHWVAEVGTSWMRSDCMRSTGCMISLHFYDSYCQLVCLVIDKLSVLQ